MTETENYMNNKNLTVRISTELYEKLLECDRSENLFNNIDFEAVKLI